MTRALTPYGITALRLNEIIDGVKMDLDQTRYLDLRPRTLLHRVWRRGSWRGNPEFRAGVRSNTLTTWNRVELTRISATSAPTRKNRIYLPMDELRDFGVPPPTCERAPEEAS